MGEPFRTLVVDDEAPARAKVKRFLGEDGRFTLVGEARDGLQALERIRDLRPDLVLLDIQMPGFSGFELLEALEPPLPFVVFATAYDRFALAAFEASAADYLLKPFDEVRFRRAMDRAAQLLGMCREDPSMKPLLARLEARPLERLVVKSEDRWIPLDLRSVFRLKAEGRWVRVYTGQGAFLVRRPLADLEARIDPGRFVRVHRGDVVALDAVAHLEPWDHGDALLVLKDGSHVPLSRTYRAGFLARWGLEG